MARAAGAAAGARRRRTTAAARAATAAARLLLLLLAALALAPAAAADADQPADAIANDPWKAPVLGFRDLSEAQGPASAESGGLGITPVSVPAGGRTDVHTLVLTDCAKYQDWQTIAAAFSWRESGQPGNLTRVVNCSPEETKKYGKVMMEVLPTFWARQYAYNARLKDWYAAYNKPGAVVDFLAKAPADEKWVVALDSDMLVHKPFLPEMFNLTEGWGIGAAGYTYLKGVVNDMSNRHVSDIAPRNDTFAGPVGRRGDQVGGPYFMLTSDMRKVAPLWLSTTEEMRQDLEAWRDSGDTSSKPGKPVWISEMYGYAFGAARAGVWHKSRGDFMLYPSYTPADIPHVIHYGLHWKLGDDWDFDKHNYFDFDPFKCPPWPAWQGYDRARLRGLTGDALTAARLAPPTKAAVLYPKEGIFPPPPHPARAANETKPYLERYRDLLSLFTLAQINAALCEFHAATCPWSAQLEAVCGDSWELYLDARDAVDSVEWSWGCADHNRECAWWVKQGECSKSEAYMRDHCAVACGHCKPREGAFVPKARRPLLFAGKPAGGGAAEGEGAAGAAGAGAGAGAGGGGGQAEQQRQDGGADAGKEERAPALPTVKEAEEEQEEQGKGGGGGGGAPKGGGGGANGKYKSPGDVREGNAYSQETRKIVLSLEKIRKVAPNGKELLKNINLGMYLGAKIGILGANGAGKSTLMKILAGVDENCEGRVVRAPGIRIGYLEQEPALADGATVAENIEPAVAHIRSMVKEYEAVSQAMAEPDADFDALTKKMERLQDTLDACNGWEVDRQLEQAVDALRCPPGDALVANLSGGERRRVALARLLLSAPDILLLDEPTNHLDAESVAWLESFLGSFRGTVVAITHDRYFLDNVAGWILELDRGQGIPFEGNYSEWLRAKDARLAQEERQQAHLLKTIEHELDFINKQAKGQQKKGRDRVRRYDELVAAANAYVKDSQVDSITIPVGPRLGDKVVEAKGVAKGFGDRLLVDGMEFSVPPGAVVGIIGGNGAGKSTLFRMIMGQQAPDAGTIELGETVVPMYVDQSRDELEANKTVYEAITGGADEIDLNGRSINARAYCSWYNFKGADQNKKVGDLSGGERNRLQLARVLRQSGNLLLLDEPTNDLDVTTLRCLEEAIANFAGSTLVVSHDRWFLDRVATHILAFEGDSQVSWFEGGWSEYDAYRRAQTGDSQPHRVKFRRLAAI